jgi:hypothetical protein
MKELIISATLVITVAALGFVGLDQLGGPNTPRVNAAPVVPDAQLSASTLAVVPASQLVTLPLHLLQAPDTRVTVQYESRRWYPLAYTELATLENQRVPGCRLELESSGEPIRISGQWSEGQRTIGAHRFGLGILTPDGSAFPRQITYTTVYADAYLVFTLIAGEQIRNPTAFEGCQAAAESVLATLKRVDN